MSNHAGGNPPYSIAIAKRPNVIRRTAREATGDAVLGFGCTVTPVAPSADRIACEILYAGLITPSIVKSCLDALCTAFGTDAISATVRVWLAEADSTPRCF